MTYTRANAAVDFAEIEFLNIQTETHPQFDNSAGLFSMDTATGLVFADKAVADAFGFCDEAAKEGIPLEQFYERIGPEFRSYVTDVVAASVETGVQIQLSYRINRPDGTGLKVLAFGQCFRSSCGKSHYYVGILVPLSSSDGKPGSDAVSHLISAHESALQLGSVEAAQKIIEAIAIILTERGALPIRH